MRILGKPGKIQVALIWTFCVYLVRTPTPFGMYEKLYRSRDRLVVIDDVDSLYSDRSGIRLLKCLCSALNQPQLVERMALFTASLGQQRIGTDLARSLRGRSSKRSLTGVV